MSALDLFSLDVLGTQNTLIANTIQLLLWGISEIKLELEVPMQTITDLFLTILHYLCVTLWLLPGKRQLVTATKPHHNLQLRKIFTSQALPWDNLGTSKLTIWEWIQSPLLVN